MNAEEAPSEPLVARVPAGAAGREERHATWLELFLDLVFVLAVSQLALALARHPTPAGAATFVALFVPVWWAWVGFAFFVTRFGEERIARRLLLLLAMLACTLLAESVADAFHGETVRYALAYAAVRAVLVALYAGAARARAPGHEVARFYVRRFGAGTGCWLASALVPPPARYGLWALGLLAELGAPLAARRLLARHPVDGSHLPERFGLFVIIVLGESVVATGNAVSHTAWSRGSVATAALGFALAAALWWTYFEAAAAAVRRALVRRGESGTVARDVYSYGHFPVVVGLTAVAAGIHLLIGSRHGEAARVMVGAGAAVYLLSLDAIELALAHGRGSALVVARLLAAAALMALAVFGGSLPAAAFAGAAVTAIAAVAAAGERAAAP